MKNPVRPADIVDMLLKMPVRMLEVSSARGCAIAFGRSETELRLYVRK